MQGSETCITAQIGIEHVHKGNRILIQIIIAELCVTHKAVCPGARPHVPPVMAEGDFRLMTPLYDNLQ